MNTVTENLIEALRAEMQQYGEMLALLEQQQQLIVQRAGAALLENLAAINAQTSIIHVSH